MPIFRMNRNRQPKENVKYFIIGSQKSGTTWLRDCLDTFVPFCKPEWYFPEFAENVQKTIDTFGRGLSSQERAIRAKAATASAWREICWPFMGEKSAYPCSSAFMRVRPDLHPQAVRLTKEYLPGSRIAVIVRDPRAVYNSLCHYLDGFRPGWSQEIDVEEFATEWSRQNLAWAADEPDVIVQYESLKADFSTTLRDTLDKMGIKHNVKDIERTKELVFSVDRLRPKQPEIYRTGTIDEWRTKVAPEIAIKIAEVAAPAMAKFGMNLSAAPRGVAASCLTGNRPAGQTASSCVLEQT
jgi:hypothetical protein